MKPILTTLIISLFWLPSLSQARLVVTDPLTLAQDAINQVVDLAEYIQMVENQVSQIETMEAQLEQVTAYVDAFGDPSQLTSIVGADDLINGWDESGLGQSLQSLQQTADGAQSIANNAGGLYSQIQNTTLSGITVSRQEPLYKPFSAVENATANYTTVYDNASQRSQALKSQMASTMQQLQAAMTDAESQKLQGVITGQTAQLKAIEEEVSEAASQAVIQDIANRNNEQKQQTARNEEVAADRHDALTKFGTMMVPDVSNDMRFGRANQP